MSQDPVLLTIHISVTDVLYCSIDDGLVACDAVDLSSVAQEPMMSMTSMSLAPHLVSSSTTAKAVENATTDYGHEASG